MHRASVGASRTQQSSRTPPERTRPTAIRIAAVAEAMPSRCVFATGTAPSPIPVMPFSAPRRVAETGPAG